MARVAISKDKRPINIAAQAMLYQRLVEMNCPLMAKAVKAKLGRELRRLQNQEKKS